MSKYVTKSLHIYYGGHTELTKTSLRDQVTLTLTRLAVKTNRSHSPTDAQPTRNFRPAGVHRPGTKPWRAQEVEGQCFRKHPESNLLGTGILCPEQLREPAKSCPAASPAHPLLKACHQTQGHATQESQVATAEPSQNAGSLENGTRPPDCLEWAPKRLFGIAGSKTHSVLWKRQWDPSQRTEPVHWWRSSSSFWR